MVREILASKYTPLSFRMSESEMCAYIRGLKAYAFTLSLYGHSFIIILSFREKIGAIFVLCYKYLDFSNARMLG